MKRLNPDKHQRARKRFKFLKFHDRLDLVDVRAHRRKPELQDALTQNSFFITKLQLLKNINLTKTFKKVCKALGGICLNLELVLYHKEKIIDVLLEHVAQDNDEALLVLLQLLTTLARDIRHEIWPSFPRIIEALLAKLNPSKDESLDAVFGTISLLFKHLEKQAVPEAKAIFHEYLEKYFCHRKPYVRRFASEAYALLLRKSTESQLRELWTDYLTKTDDENACLGLAQLAFQQMKGANKTFHSSFEVWSNILFDVCESLSTEDTSEWYQTFIGTWATKLVEHSELTSSSRFLQFLQLRAAGPLPATSLSAFCEFRNCFLVREPELTQEILDKNLRDSVDTRARLWLSAWRAGGRHDIIFTTLRKHLPELLKTTRAPEEIMQLLKKRRRQTAAMLPPLVSYGIKLLKSDISDAFSLLVNLLTIDESQVKNILRSFKKLKKVLSSCLVPNHNSVQEALKLAAFVGDASHQALALEILNTAGTPETHGAALHCLARLGAGFTVTDKAVELVLTNPHNLELLKGANEWFKTSQPDKTDDLVEALLPNLTSSYRDLFIVTAAIFHHLRPADALLSKFHELATLDLVLTNTGVMRSSVDGLSSFSEPNIAACFAIGLIRTRFRPFAKAGSTLLTSVLKNHDAWVVLSGYLWKLTDLTHIQGPKGGDDELLTYNRSTRTAEETWLSIMEVLKDCLQTTSKNGKELSEKFLAFLTEQYDVLRPATGVIADGVNTKLMGRVMKMLSAWLEVMSSVHAMKQLKISATIQSKLLHLLQTNSPPIQNLCLQCLFIWKENALLEHRDHLLALMKHKADLKSCLLGFHIPQNETRPRLLEVLTSILYPRMIGRKSTASTRKIITSFLCAYSSEELQLLMDLMHASFNWDDLANVDTARILGYLSVVSDILEPLAISLTGVHGDRILNNIFKLVNIATSREKSTEIWNKQDKQWSTILRNCVKAMRLCMDNLNLNIDMRAKLSETVQTAISYGQYSGAIVELFYAASGHQSSVFIMQPDICQDFLFKLLGKCDATMASKIFLILENLLSMVEFDDWIPKSLKRHAEEILEGFSKRLSNLQTSGKVEFPEKDLEIATKLIPYVSKGRTSQLLGEALLPLLKLGSCRDSIKSKMLLLLDQLIPQMQDPTVLISTLTALYPRIHAPTTCDRLTQTLKTLAQCQPEIKRAVDILDRLNAFVGKLNCDYNYDQRLSEYLTLSKQSDLTLAELRMIVPVVYRDMKHQETVIQNAAEAFMKRIVSLDSSDYPEGELHMFLRRSVIHQLLSNLKTKRYEVRDSMIKIIAVLIRKHRGILGNLHVLMHEEEEADFWENIVHIQSSRRHKALLRLCRHSGDPLEETAINVLLPIVRSFVMEHREKNNEPLVEAGVASLGLLASWCSWRRYRSFVRSLIEFLKQNPKRERVVVRILVAIFDSFHFNVGDVHECLVEEEDEEMVEEAADDKEEMQIEAPSEDEGEEDAEMDELDPEEVRHTIRKIFLTNLFELMFDRKKNIVRVNISRCIVKLIKQLPPKEFSSQFRRLVLNIINSSRTKEKERMAEAKACLCAVARTVGVRFLGSILRQLIRSLRRGFELQVLNHLVHGVLVAVTENCNNGDIDQDVPNLVKYLLGDMYGVANADRQAEILARKAQYKSPKTFASIETIGAFIQFDPTALVVISNLTKVLLKEKPSIASMEKTRGLLKNFLSGLRRNSSVAPKDVFIFCHQQIEAHLDRLKDATATESSFAQRRSGRVTAEERLTVQVTKRRDVFRVDKAKTLPQLSPLLEFYLRLLQLTIGGVNLQDFRPMLVPFIPFCVSILNDTQAEEEIQVLVLKVSQALMRIPDVDGMKSYVDQLSDICFDNLKVSSTALLNESYRCLAGALSSAYPFELTKDQLDLLLIFIRQHMHNTDEQKLVFGIAKALLVRKILSPHIYDLMKSMSQTIVQTMEASTRNRCVNLLVTFLLDYPLTPKRLEEHLNLILGNLDYERPAGRKSMLVALGKIIQQFPKDVINNYHQRFFLALAQHRGNEEEKDCLEQNEKVLLRLFAAVPHKAIQGYVKMLVTWMKKGVGLTMMSAKVATVLVKSEVNIPIPALLEEAMAQVSIVMHVEDRLNELFVLLALVEGIWQIATPKLMNPDETAFLISWKGMEALATHRKSWVRESVFRVWLRYLEEVGIQSLMNSESKALITKDNVQSFGEYVVETMQSYELTESLAEVGLRSLVLFSGAVYQLFSDAPNIQEILHGYFSRLCYGLIRSKNQVQRKSILEWLSVMCTRVSSEDLQPHLHTVLRPIWRLVEVVPTQEPELSLYRIAISLAKELKKKMGVEAYLTEWNKIRKERVHARDKRKRIRLLQKVADPAKAQLKRMAKRKKEKLRLKKRWKRKKGFIVDE